MICTTEPCKHLPTAAVYQEAFPNLSAQDVVGMTHSAHERFEGHLLLSVLRTTLLQTEVPSCSGSDAFSKETARAGRRRCGC